MASLRSRTSTRHQSATCGTTIRASVLSLLSPVIGRAKSALVA
jgi:hypothetical protein